MLQTVSPALRKRGCQSEDPHRVNNLACGVVHCALSMQHCAAAHYHSLMGVGLSNFCTGHSSGGKHSTRPSNVGYILIASLNSWLNPASWVQSLTRPTSVALSSSSSSLFVIASSPSPTSFSPSPRGPFSTSAPPSSS